MIKLRNRLLVTLVLAAAAAGVLGTAGTATASRLGTHAAGITTLARPGAAPCSGEPDTNGQSGLQQPVKTGLMPSGSAYGWGGVRQWIAWSVRVWLLQFPKRLP